MKQKLAETTGTFVSCVVVALLVYFTKSLIEFIIGLIILTIICMIISWILPDAEDSDKSNVEIKYILCDPLGNEKEITKKQFEVYQKFNDNILSTSSKSVAKQEELMYPVITDSTEDFGDHWLFESRDEH